MKKELLYPEPNRKEALGVNGMVAAAHPLASGVGLQVLREGGNAFDAAPAVLATLNVVEPYMSGVGGIGVALAYVASEGRVRALDFSGRAPKAAEPSRFTDETKGTGILAPLVPGNVAGWFTLHQAYGTMDPERLFEPAIRYAEDGFPVTSFNHRHFIAHAPRVLRFPEGASMIYANGRPPEPGERLAMPLLAESLRKIAAEGPDVFYTGEIAERIVGACREMGGLLTHDDLAEYEARWVEPIDIDYRGYRISTMPPNSSAFQVLQTLKLIEGYDGPELAYQHPDTLHRMMEAVKLCVADRLQYSGDPDFVDVPLEGLLSDWYASRQRERIDLEKVGVNPGDRFAAEPPEGALEPGSPEAHTTHLSIADRDGNVVSLTQTLGGGFGSAFAVPGTGIFLNNMAGDFDLDERSPNVVGPGKRVEFPVAPTQTFEGERFLLSIGTPGGHGILQTTLQMLVNVLDFGMSVQQAIEAPRFSCGVGREVSMEERFPLHVRRALQTRGHEVKLAEAWAIGGAQGVMADSEHGVLHGGADPRRDGFAVGY